MPFTTRRTRKGAARGRAQKGRETEKARKKRCLDYQVNKELQKAKFPVGRCFVEKMVPAAD